jgi:signal transduction histidine kinase
MGPRRPAGPRALGLPRWQRSRRHGYPWAVSDHESSLTPDQRAHQAEAQREVLLEALEIFTHDLSNPLQSLIVLTELALDDTPEGTEEYDRCRQSLEAAERMRTLVQGLAGLTRSIDGPRTSRVVVDRFISVLSRRWERHQVRVSVDMGAIERTPTPANLETVLLNLGLATVAAATERNHPRYELSVRGISREGQPLSCVVELTLVGHNAGGAAAPVELARPHMERLERLLDGSASVRMHEEAGSVYIEFAPETRR